MLTFSPAAAITKLVIDTVSESKNKKDDPGANDANNAALLMLEKQTRIVRDLAIAGRIDTAEKVTIEEFYQTKGDGKAGVQTDGSNLNIGLSGSGEKVTKRIYTFEGWREGTKLNINEDLIDALLKHSDKNKNL